MFPCLFVCWLAAAAQSFKFLREYPLTQQDVRQRFAEGTSPEFLDSSFVEDENLSVRHCLPCFDYTHRTLINLIFTDIGQSTHTKSLPLVERKKKKERKNIVWGEGAYEAARRAGGALLHYSTSHAYVCLLQICTGVMTPANVSDTLIRLY